MKANKEFKMEKFEKMMTDALGDKWREYCPDELTEDEKYEIKRALLSRFEKGEDSFAKFLECFALINLYPEKQ